MIPEAVFSATILSFFDPIRRYLDDPSVTEVMINGPGKIYIERKGKLQPNRIESFGYGSTKPLKDELTDADAQVNRRVEFRLIKPDTDKPADGGGEWK